MNLPFIPPFNEDILAAWCFRYTPATIEMTDKQYSHFAGIMRGSRKEFRGIPIEFIDAPKP
jgi:hypothetical protein